MTRKNIKGVFSRSMQEEATEPIIENSKLPLMDDSNYGKTSHVKKQKGDKLMDDAPKKARKKGKLMRPLAKQAEKEQPAQNYKEQVPKSRKPEPGFYIVFRMHVQNGVISVTGCKRVNSELVQPPDILSGGLTYEAILGNERLSLSSVPDFGEQRSFPRPPGEKGGQGHHITILPGFDFSVRIPGHKITEKDLPKLRVTLYRFKEHLPSFQLTEAPLSHQFEKEARIMAQMDGIKLSALPQDVKTVVKRAFEK